MTSAVEPVSVNEGIGATRRLSVGKTQRWLIGRVALAVLTLFLVSILVFVATSVLPGDVARSILGPAAPTAALDELRHELGLDRPIVEQYFSWLGGCLTGDFGQSLVAREPTSAIVGPAAVNTLTLAFLSFLVAVPLSLLLGCVAALRRDSRLDRALQAVALVLAATPEFIVGIVLVLVFATNVFHWFPAVALIPPDDRAYEHLDQMILPIATVVLVTVPYLTILTRAAVIDTLESEYVAMARLKGVRERSVVVRHALRNALAPIFQALALAGAYLTGGLVVIEFLFNFPGLGGALAEAVRGRDIAVVQATVLILATVVVVCNLLADLLTVLTTPRLRTGGRR